MISETDKLEQDRADQLSKSTTEFFLSGLRDNSFSMYVATHDNVIVAMGGINYFKLPPTEWCTSGKTAYVGNMFTLPDYRNRGIAFKIVSILMNEAEQLSIERVILKPTKKGVSIYKKYGFDSWSDAMVFFI